MSRETLLGCRKPGARCARPLNTRFVATLFEDRLVVSRHSGLGPHTPAWEHVQVEVGLRDAGLWDDYGMEAQTVPL